MTRRSLDEGWFDQHDLGFEIGAAGALCGEAGGEVGITGADRTLLDEVEYVPACAFDPRPLGPERLQMRLPFVRRGRTLVEQAGE